jgi:hypothetical protein
MLSIDIGEKNFAYCIGRLQNNNQVDIIKIEHYNLVEKKKQTVLDSCKKISTILENDLFIKTCFHVIIEQQTNSNVRTQRCAQHIWSFFYTRYRNKNVIFVPARLKTFYFLGKNKLSYIERKKWVIQKTLNVLENNAIALEIKTMQKQDDICDAILQLIVYVKTNYDVLFNEMKNFSALSTINNV